METGVVPSMDELGRPELPRGAKRPQNTNHIHVKPSTYNMGACGRLGE